MVEQPQAKEKIFRLKPEEDARLPRLIEYAQRQATSKRSPFRIT